MTTSPRSGVAFAAGAYAIWGLLPLFIAATAPTTAVELVGWRVLLSVVFAAIVLVVIRKWGETARLWRDRRTVGLLAVAGVLVSTNWLLYVGSVATGRSLEGALGYFLNPLVSIVLGLVVLRERLRPLQWVAVGITVAAFVVLAVGYGQFPWLSIAIATTFGVYGLVKKRVGPSAGAVPGFFVETALIVPIGIGCLVFAATVGGGLTVPTTSAWNTLTVSFAGVVTAVPLLLFAAASKRLRLIELGMMQFIAPIMHFTIGVAVFREDMPAERWAGFSLVWLALAFFVVDLARQGRAAR